METRVKELALARSGNNQSPRKTLLTLLIGNSYGPLQVVYNRWQKSFEHMAPG